MKFAVPGLISAVVGIAIGFAVIVPVTSAVEGTSRPQVDRSGNAPSSILGQVEYGSR